MLGDARGKDAREPGDDCGVVETAGVACRDAVEGEAEEEDKNRLGAVTEVCRGVLEGGCGEEAKVAGVCDEVKVADDS